MQHTRTAMDWIDVTVTLTRTKLIVAVVMLLLLVGVGAKLTLDYVAGEYGAGFDSGMKAMANSHHGSAAYAQNDNGSQQNDIGRMDPYDCYIYDHNANLRDAMGHCFNGDWSRVVRVTDENGVGDGGGHRNMDFRGVFHYACAGETYKCGNASRHD